MGFWVIALIYLLFCPYAYAKPSQTVRLLAFFPRKVVKRMAILVVIEKLAEDDGAVFYRYGPMPGTMIATAAIVRRTGEVILISVDEDAGVKLLNLWERRRLSMALRRVRQGNVYPQRFCYLDQLRRRCEVEVGEESQAVLTINVLLGDGRRATADVDRESGDATFIEAENAGGYGESFAGWELRRVMRTLREHYSKGEFPEITEWKS